MLHGAWWFMIIMLLGSIALHPLYDDAQIYLSWQYDGSGSEKHVSPAPAPS